MLIGVGEADHLAHRWQGEALQLRLQGLVVIDAMLHPELLQPGLAFRTRGRGNQGAIGELAHQLHQHGAHPTGRTHHQQAASRLSSIPPWRQPQAVEEQLHGGDRRERQRRRFSRAEAAGPAGNQAMVHGVELAVAAGAIEGTGIPNAIARAEALNGRPHCLHHTSHIPAQHAPLLGGGLLAAPHLGVHGIHRHRLHPHQQIAGAGLGGRELNVEQTVDVAAGSRAVVGDGAHRYP